MRIQDAEAESRYVYYGETEGLRLLAEYDMAKQQIIASEISKFANDQEEADWWASPQGREFVKGHAKPMSKTPVGGSKLVAKLGKANSVQIALRLPLPDLAKAREIAERKGIGYQTLLKMLVHEGLQRVERPEP